MSTISSWPDPAEIEHKLLSYRPRTVELHPKDTICRLTRLTTDDYHRLRRHSIPIEEDPGFYFALTYSLWRTDKELNLAQIYMALSSLFGESSAFYDDYKGSFAFPLFLHLQRGEQAYPYLLRVKDWKGSLEFALYRVLDPKDAHPDRSVYHKPFAEEFNRDEINYFISYFYGYLEGYFSVVGEREGKPFFRKIDAVWGIYGYRDGQFFEEQYDSAEAYRAAIRELEQHHGQ